jgi:hypothetical protein
MTLPRTSSPSPKVARFRGTMPIPTNTLSISSTAGLRQSILLISGPIRSREQTMPLPTVAPSPSPSPRLVSTTITVQRMPTSTSSGIVQRPIRTHRKHTSPWRTSSWSSAARIELPPSTALVGKRGGGGAWTRKSEEEGSSGGEQVAHRLLKQGKIKGRGDKNRSLASLLRCNCRDILVGSAAAGRGFGMTIALTGKHDVAPFGVGLPMSDLLVFESRRK